MQRTAFWTLCLLISLIISHYSCTTVEEKPDVSHLTANIPLIRFEQELFEIDASEYPAALNQLAAQYPDFFNLYFQQILAYDPNTGPEIKMQQLARFINHANIQALYDTVQQHFPDLTSLQTDLNQAFKYYQHYFPNHQLPKAIYTHLSEFGPAAATLDSSLIALSLDMYLGQDFVYYPSVGIPNYLTKRLRPEYMAVNAMAAYLKGVYEQPLSPSRLIDRIVYEGKILYALDKLLPDTPDSLKIGYSGQKLQWCIASEASIWAYLIQEDLLFEGQYRDYIKFVSEAPHTAGMPPEAPGRVPIWLGWQIVRQYKQQHPKQSLHALFQIKDGQEILNAAQYKPRK